MTKISPTLLAATLMIPIASAQNSPPLYTEKYRPQFHFTSDRDWLNDPNGMVYFDGEYHLYFQRRVGQLHSDGNMTWGHAVSLDLVHWAQLPDAIKPDEHGSIWSGSAVVDWNNTSGFGKDGKPPLVAFYTAAKEPFHQRLVYSNDRGRSWTQYDGNPVIPYVNGKNRDPKVIWDKASKQWLLVLYLDRPNEFALYASPDLKSWKMLQTITMDDNECPDFFPLPLDDDASKTMWVFTAADSRYLLGTFDGKHFTPTTDTLRCERGPNYYAAQTFSDTRDGRRIQIGWMRRDGEYPEMPFNQQMSFPRVLTLRSTPRGPRLFATPVHEILSLYDNRTQVLENNSFKPGRDAFDGAVNGNQLDLAATIGLGEAKSVTLNIRGHAVTLHAEGALVAVTSWDRRVTVPMVNGGVKLRVLVDRTSIEIFIGDGEAVLSGCFIPPDNNRTVTLTAEGGIARVVFLEANALRTAWPVPAAAK